jgi:hypothetical protein
MGFAMVSSPYRPTPINILNNTFAVKPPLDVLIVLIGCSEIE